VPRIGAVFGLCRCAETSMATGVNQFALPADPDVLARLVVTANALDLIAVIMATTTTEQPGQRGAGFRAARLTVR
jgi:hypothetical protein